MIRSACGLDCPDSCAFETEPGTFPTLHPRTHNGALCRLLNHSIHHAERITTPTVDGVEVSMDEALDAVAQRLGKGKSLLWRGSGNFGVMQQITDLLMERIGGTLTRGSLCDGAGEAGIIEGRGVNRTLPPEEIAKADTIVVWGRNLDITSTHTKHLLKGKKIIVIDPVRTPLAKEADLHIQIRPRSDFYLAMVLSRFVYMHDHEEKEWLEEFGTGFGEFYDFTREFRIKAILHHLDLSLDDIGEMLYLITQPKTVFMVGTGVQKYSTGHYVLRAIDSLAASLGLFGKEGSGVSYNGSSKLGFENPFTTKCKRVSKVKTPFEQFDTVLVQGGNPLASMPDTARVEEALDGKEIVYFGLYPNETSAKASVVIPAMNFFEKDDVRLSYGDTVVRPMNKVTESVAGISEYEFTKAIIERLGLKPIESEEHYLERWLEQCEETDGELRSPAHTPLPYSDGFGEDGGDEFEFVDDYDDDFESNKHLTKFRKIKDKDVEITEYWLLTTKSKKALNTQFGREDTVTLHPSIGFEDGERVKVGSEYGEHEFIVKNSEDIRKDCAVIRANAYGVNRLTPSIESIEGNSACYQEVKVVVERV